MPGLLGASLRINARFFEREMSQVTKKLLCLTNDFDLLTIQAKDFFISYKQTLAHKNPLLILGAWFCFEQNSTQQEIQSSRKFCVDQRLKKHHFDFPSCGSVFKNNRQNSFPTGQLIDQLGFCGMRKGDAQVSPHHGNFIWNLKSALSQDVYDLMEFLKDKLRTNGFIAEYEVDFKGYFKDNKNKKTLFGVFETLNASQNAPNQLKQKIKHQLSQMGLLGLF
jgi:UDP-N-acetylmuramate dehydrogenase